MTQAPAIVDYLNSLDDMVGWKVSTVIVAVVVFLILFGLYELTSSIIRHIKNRKIAKSGVDPVGFLDEDKPLSTKVEMPPLHPSQREVEGEDTPEPEGEEGENVEKVEEEKVERIGEKEEMSTLEEARRMLARMKAANVQPDPFHTPSDIANTGQFAAIPTPEATQASAPSIEDTQANTPTPEATQVSIASTEVTESVAVADTKAPFGGEEDETFVVPPPPPPAQDSVYAFIEEEKAKRRRQAAQWEDDKFDSPIFRELAMTRSFPAIVTHEVTAPESEAPREENEVLVFEAPQDEADVPDENTTPDNEVLQAEEPDTQEAPRESAKNGSVHLGAGDVFDF